MKMPEKIYIYLCLC